MKREELRELRELLAKATPGKWYLVPVRAYPHLRNMCSTAPSGGLDFTSVASMLSDVPTAEAIVALRNQATELLDALDAVDHTFGATTLKNAVEKSTRLERENARLREALRQVRAKAGSHTVAVESAERGVDDPGFSGIYSVADRALTAQESADGE